MDASFVTFARANVRVGMRRARSGDRVKKHWSYC